MINKIKTLLWFLSKPTFYRHGLELFLRKFRTNFDSPLHISQATNWAAQHAVSVQKALELVGIIEEGAEVPKISQQLLKEANLLAQQSKVKMGGAGDIHLIYAATLLSGSKKAIETGIAYGWSSLSMLAGLDDHPSSLLISIDMPYPKMNNEDYVGIVVPNFLREKWYLIKEPDRRGILKAIKKINQQVDICHYDSDKSYYGRAYGYPLLWNALRDGGIFISDDIQDNLAFKNFVESKNLIFAVTEYKGKYIGITKK
jgi:predicted O-methyltransferase YrrM